MMMKQRKANVNRDNDASAAAEGLDGYESKGSKVHARRTPLASHHGEGASVSTARYHAHSIVSNLRRCTLENVTESAFHFSFDVCFGLCVSLLLVVMAIWLDGTGTLHLPYAKEFEMALFRSEAIREALAEESIVQIVTAREYNEMQVEIEELVQRVREEQEYLETYTAEAVEINKELPSIRAEQKYLRKIFEEEIWCIECKWGGGIKCKDRMNYIMERDRISEKDAIMALASEEGKGCNKRGFPEKAKDEKR